MELEYNVTYPINKKHFPYSGHYFINIRESLFFFLLFSWSCALLARQLE